MWETGSEFGERREIHNASIDEQLAHARRCGQLHLPSGRVCSLPAAHGGGCQFMSPAQAHIDAAAPLQPIGLDQPDPAGPRPRSRSLPAESAE